MGNFPLRIYLRIHTGYQYKNQVQNSEQRLSSFQKKKQNMPRNHVYFYIANIGNQANRMCLCSSSFSYYVLRIRTDRYRHWVALKYHLNHCNMEVSTNGGTPSHRPFLHGIFPNKNHPAIRGYPHLRKPPYGNGWFSKEITYKGTGTIVSNARRARKRQQVGCSRKDATRFVCCMNAPLACFSGIFVGCWKWWGWLKYLEISWSDILSSFRVWIASLMWIKSTQYNQWFETDWDSLPRLPVKKDTFPSLEENDSGL